MANVLMLGIIVLVTKRRPKWLSKMIYVMWTVNSVMCVVDSHRCIPLKDIMETMFFQMTYIAMYTILITMINVDFVMSCYYANTTFILTTWLFYGNLYGYRNKETILLV